MKKVLLLLAVVVAAVAGFTRVAGAQYMYLDANGNGIHDVGDKMAVNASPTTVDVWVDTNHNRDGSVATCNSGTEALSILSYVVWLRAINGTVTYSGFVNQQAGFTTNFGEVNAGDDFYKNGFGGALTAVLPPGLYKIASLTITAVTGAAHVTIVDNGPGSGDITSFGTQCFGNDLDNTYKLVGASTVGSDWTDVDGLGAANGTPVTGTTWGKIKQLYR